ncbi:MAG: glycosyltransferase family 1 protein [Deltaproteobacteria bacterium]|nr:MAG: glycosyltransferase family 1 protein [Deltaproteobacteria bacterium]
MSTHNVIIVLGLLGQFPLAGIAWQLIHHLAGLQRLGFEVYYVEDTGTAPYDPRVKSLVYDCTYSLQVIADALRRLGLEDAWAYRDGRTGQWHGLSQNRVQDLFARALCAINLCGASNPATLTFRPTGKLLYLETDPVLNQVRLDQGDTVTLQFLAGHDAHVTYGENLGEADCPIPLSHFAWQKTRPPVAVELWPFCSGQASSRFTTVTTWHNRGKDLCFRGETYYWSKHLNFLPLADLPRRTSQELELATEVDEEAVRSEFQRNGWVLTDPLTVSRDIGVYHEYICTSRGEFTASKDVVVRTRSGWFSDRSVCYLAAGKPVVTQDTGFSKFIPTGHGLFAFSTPEEALAALETINRDYCAHARAAREIAQEYFDAAKVLAKMLRDVGIA